MRISKVEYNFLNSAHLEFDANFFPLCARADLFIL